MAVVSNISVGDIQYYVTDAIPTHTASKGSIAIVLEDGYEPTIYQNNNGSTVWVRLITPIYGSIYVTDLNLNTYTIGTDTQNTWYQMVAAGTWNASSQTNTTSVSGNTIDYYGMEKSQVVTSNAGAYNDNAFINSVGLGTYLIQSHQKFTTNDKWNDIECSINRNNVVPTKYNGTTVFTGNAMGGIKNFQVLEELPRGAWMSGTYRYITRESGGGGGPTTKAYTLQDVEIQSILLDRPRRKILLYEDWSGGSFSGSGWTLVNDTTNAWYVGTSTTSPVSGTKCAYISNDGGTTYSYSKNVNDASHFYRDITFPSATKIWMEFDWKCWGENSSAANQYDYMTVVITDTTTTPVAGSEVTTTEATGNNSLPYPTPSGNGRIGANRNLSATPTNAQFGKYNEGFGGSNAFWRPEGIDLTNYAGSTKRLVFTWRDDTTAGDDPPAAIDNIKIYYY